MLTNLQKINTDIGRIHEIPSRFFERIEASDEFGDHLFPEWARQVFDTTTLFNQFEVVYNKYKGIGNQNERELIVRAFQHDNRVEDLCNIVNGIDVIELGELNESIQDDLKTLFRYLYNTALNYQGYTNFVGTTVKESIDLFNKSNKVQICPFCGIEAFLNLEGQSRLALDHWLCQDLFPMNSVNFDNLMPIGDKCNSRPAKGTKNILIDAPETRNRVAAFYPYQPNHGLSTSFNFINEPSVDGITDEDWQFEILPANPTEKNKFDSWNTVFNIKSRYLDYYRKNVFDLWEDDYKEFIEDDNDLTHATTVEEFKSNLRIYKSAFQLKKRIGAVLLRPFIDYLLKEAGNSYLFGLLESIRKR